MHQSTLKGGVGCTPWLEINLIRVKIDLIDLPVITGTRTEHRLKGIKTAGYKNPPEWPSGGLGLFQYQQQMLTSIVESIILPIPVFVFIVPVCFIFVEGRYFNLD
jgi:hypothetical protein